MAASSSPGSAALRCSGGLGRAEYGGRGSGRILGDGFGGRAELIDGELLDGLTLASSNPFQAAYEFVRHVNRSVCHRRLTLSKNRMKVAIASKMVTTTNPQVATEIYFSLVNHSGVLGWGKMPLADSAT